MQRTTASGLSYREEGSGDPIVLVGGSLQDQALWEHQAATLARRYRVIRCNLKGHSAGQAGNLHVRELEELLHDLRVGRCRLAGHGPGALAAFGLARQQSGVVSHLALVDPIVRRSELNAVQEVWHLESLLQWLEVGYGTAVRSPETVAVLRDAIREQTLAQFAGPRPLPALPRSDAIFPTALSCPCLVLIGELEVSETVEIARMLFGGVPEGRFLSIPGASRRSPAEAPDDVTRELVSFFL
jgi:pimeloyl-ACP methyl ester carboxylesterase